MSTTPKSGSPAKRDKRRKGPKMVPATECNELLASAQELNEQLVETQRRAWASNQLLAGALAQAGGAIDIERDVIAALRQPWEIGQTYDEEARVYRVRLVEAPEPAAAEVTP